MSTIEEKLRRLAIRDDRYVHRLLARADADATTTPLEPKTYALARIAALIALDATPASYMSAVESARRAGANDDEMVACLEAVLPAVGITRAVSAAPKLGLALGYDVGAALEESDFVLG